MTVFEAKMEGAHLLRKLKEETETGRWRMDGKQLDQSMSELASLSNQPGRWMDTGLEDVLAEKNVEMQVVVCVERSKQNNTAREQKHEADGRCRARDGVCKGTEEQ